MATVDEYRAAFDQRETARAQVQALGAKFQAAGETLQDPERVYLTDPGPTRKIVHLLNEADVPSWSQIAEAMQRFRAAEEAFFAIDRALPEEERRQLTP